MQWPGIVGEEEETLQDMLNVGKATVYKLYNKTRWVQQVISLEQTDAKD